MAEQKFTTSFIPKKSVRAPKVGGPSFKSGTSFLTTITLVIFIATLFVTGGTYVYKLSLKGRIETQQKNLVKARGAFDPDFISQATRLNDRLMSVRSLIDDHVAPSQVFSLLENETLSTVRFDSLRYYEDEDNKLRLDVSGLAKGFQSIVLQSDRYGNTGKVRDVLFSDLQPTEEGLVSFSFGGTVESRAVSYRNLVDTIPIQSSGNNDEE